VDIGGGTTKLALIESGRVTATAAFHVGGRLQVVDSDNRIVRLEPGGRRLAERAGFDWSLGDTIDLAELDPLAEFMAAAVVSALVEPGTAATEGLFLTEPLGPLGTIDGVIFSGGVAEYIYGREQRDFGDLGRRLGEALRRKLDDGALPWPCLPAKECIRATVMGASEYSVQLSGNTHYVSQHGALLPRRNLQVIKPHYDFPVDVEPEAVAAAIKRQLVLFDLDDAVQEFALAFQWRGDPSYERVLGFARGIALGLSCAIDAGRALYLILDGDLAQVLGGVLRDDLAIGTDLMVIDGIQLVDFDYVDLGKIRLPSRTVPVTVKSLLFQDSRQETRPPRLLTSHHHGPHSHSHTHGNTHHDSLKFKMPGSELQGTHIIWG
jgi:ethanolamine utilization protein EutA